MTHWSDSWDNFSPKPCLEAWEWAKTQPGWQTAWAQCQRGDWMAYRLGRGLIQGSPEHRKFILATIECGRLSLKYTIDPRVAAVYEALAAWANGTNVDLEKVLASAVSEASAASAWASEASAASAWASAWASEASAASAWASARASAWASAKASTLAECAAIYRRWYPVAPEPNL